MKITIPVYQPTLDGNEKKYVLECLDTNWISSKGRFVQEFERRFAEYTGVRYASAVCNGTAALHLVLLALGIGAGDEVIVPTLTYVASVNAISYTGATPIFVDSVRETWQMDPNDVRQKLSNRTRAIMAVHLYGHPCDLDSLRAIADQHGLFLVEDCAEAFGTLYQGRHVGGTGQISAYSFYGNKAITTGEGGMVVTNDPTLHERAVRFRGQGLALGREYWHDVIGYNYRMTNICAAIGLAQLERADATLQRKRELAARYRQGLAGLPLTFHDETAGARHSYWMCSILVEDRMYRDPLREHLATSGIETRPVFFPVHTMPMYSQHFQRHPVAEDLGWRGVNLPSWPALEEKQVMQVIGKIKDYFAAR